MFRRALALWLFFFATSAFAPVPSLIEECLLNYETFAWTGQAIGEFLRVTRNNESLLASYQNGAPSGVAGGIVPFEWKMNNQERGSRAFKADASSLKASRSDYPDRGMERGPYQDYLAEMSLMQRLSAARTEFRASPENEKAKAQMAALTSEYLSRTGVPNHVSAEQTVIVEPMNEAEWTQWNKEHHGGVGAEAPTLVRLAAYLKRRNLALAFHPNSVAGIKNEGGHFQREAHISLGLKELIDTDLTSTLLHEKIHFEGYLARDKPWGTWTSMDELDKWDPERVRTLRPKLPYMEVEMRKPEEDTKKAFSSRKLSAPTERHSIMRRRRNDLRVLQEPGVVAGVI